MDDGLREANPRTWPERACKDADPDVFFGPDDPKKARRFRYTDARRICNSCPIRPVCAEWAVTTGERHGMWGGWTPAELEAERRRRREAAAAAAAAPPPNPTPNAAGSR